MLLFFWITPVFSKDYTDVDNPGGVSTSDIFTATMDGIRPNTNWFISGQCFFLVCGGPETCPPVGGCCIERTNFITLHEPDLVVSSQNISGTSAWKEAGLGTTSTLRKLANGIFGMPITAGYTAKKGMDAPTRDVGVYGNPLIQFFPVLSRWSNPMIMDICDSQVFMLLPYFNTETDIAWRKSPFDLIFRFVGSLYGLAESTFSTRSGAWGRLLPLSAELPINTNPGLAAGLSSYRAAFIATGGLNVSLSNYPQYAILGGLGHIPPPLAFLMYTGKCPAHPKKSPECRTHVTEPPEDKNGTSGLWQLVYSEEGGGSGEESSGGKGGGSRGKIGAMGGFMDKSKKLQDALLDISTKGEKQPENFIFNLWRVYKCCERPWWRHNWTFLFKIEWDKRKGLQNGPPLGYDGGTGGGPAP